MSTKSYPEARTDIVCPDCGANMPFVPNQWERGKMHYRCVNDCCTHGAHPDGKPLGVPADKVTRLARMDVHYQFDKLWRGPGAPMSRKKAYRWMQAAMGMTEAEAHIGEFTVEQCRTLIERLRDYRKG